MGASESGLRGATVTLMDENGEEVASRQTIRSGEFTFDRLMPGDYALRVTLPYGYQYTAEGGESLAPRTGAADAEIFGFAVSFFQTEHCENLKLTKYTKLCVLCAIKLKIFAFDCKISLKKVEDF